jgi:hypothetical protein
VVVLLATWTVIYHVCLVLRIGTTPAVVLEVLALAGAVVVARRRRFDDAAPAPATATSPDRGRLLRGLRLLTLGSALVAACATAVSAPWVLTWVPWLLAAGAGSLWAGLVLTRARPGVPESGVQVSDGPGSDAGEDRWSATVALCWAVGLAVLSMWSLRPNPDDLFYVNLSQWVASHGQFPVRDTLFSNLAYPMANWPPVASYDALVGVVAGLVGAHAATIEYVVVTPLATFLAVLAMWRLLRTWRVRQLAWVLSTGLVFLLCDGTTSYAAPGGLFLTRLWQGKVVLLCVAVPLLLSYALRYVERPTARRLLPLVLAGTASVGLSTTSIFLVPIVAVGAMVPLFLRDRGRAVLGFVAMAGYALGAGVVTEALGGRSADDFGVRRLYRFDASWLGGQLLLTDVVGFVLVLALLLGALLVPHPAARLTSGLLVLATGYVFVPGAMRAAYDAIGLGPTLWRISWGASAAALVGVLAVYGAGPLLVRLAHRVGRPAWRPAAVPVAALATMGLLAAFGAPIVAGDTGTELRMPFHWQRYPSNRHLAGEILDAARPGELVLAPDSLAITIAVTTTAVKTVAPRDYYMYYLRDEPSFHYPQRLALVDYVNGDGPSHLPGLAEDLEVVGVDIACTLAENPVRYRALRRAGFRPLVSSAYYRCLKRP